MTVLDLLIQNIVGVAIAGVFLAVIVFFAVRFGLPGAIIAIRAATASPETSAVHQLLANSIPPEVLARYENLVKQVLDVGVAVSPNAQLDDLLIAIKELSVKLTDNTVATVAVTSGTVSKSDVQNALDQMATQMKDNIGTVG